MISYLYILGVRAAKLQPFSETAKLSMRKSGRGRGTSLSLLHIISLLLGGGMGRGLSPFVVPEGLALLGQLTAASVCISFVKTHGVDSVFIVSI